MLGPSHIPLPLIFVRQKRTLADAEVGAAGNAARIGAGRAQCAHAAARVVARRAKSVGRAGCVTHQQQFGDLSGQRATECLTAQCPVWPDNAPVQVPPVPVLKLPGAHGTQAALLVLPMAPDVSDPGAHGVHVAVPMLLANVLTGHTVQQQTSSIENTVAVRAA